MWQSVPETLYLTSSLFVYKVLLLSLLAEECNYSDLINACQFGSSNGIICLQFMTWISCKLIIVVLIAVCINFKLRSMS